MDKTFFVKIANHDSVIVKVKDDVNRPNNNDCETVLEYWLLNNYGGNDYEYTNINDCKIENL